MIVEEMNRGVGGGNEVNQEMTPINCSANLNSSDSKAMLKDSFSTSETDRSNLSGGADSDPGSSRPMTTSTPIADQSLSEYSTDAPELPTSSSEGNFGCTSLSAPKFGTLIPNRVFVGGISSHTTESELMQLFSKFGSVRATKIIMDRAGVSKGYGFVTFETEEEARRLFNAMNNRELPPIVHRDRRLNIAPAVKKQQSVRQTPYSSQTIGNGCASTFSPPPFDSPAFFFNGQQQQHHTEAFFGPPVPIPDNYFPQTNGFPQTPVQSTASMQPFYNPIPALGQTLSGPNGGVFFVPVNTLPYQQIFTPL